MVFTTGRFVLSRAVLFVSIFFCPVQHCDHLTWGRESWYVFLVHLFVYFAHVNFCPFSLPLGVRDWLWLVILALPGLSY